MGDLKRENNLKIVSREREAIKALPCVRFEATWAWQDVVIEDEKSGQT